MRETLQQQARIRHVGRGSLRPPVRRDANVNADRNGLGETGQRLPRAGLRGVSALVISVAALCVLLLAVTPATAADGGGAAWVDLNGGRVGNVVWSVKVARQPGGSGAGPSGARRPCLMVGMKRERNAFEYEGSRYSNCVDPGERLAATEAPLIVTGAQARPDFTVRLTAVGMIASLAADRVRVTLDDGREATIPLEQPGPELRQAADLTAFRYAAFAIPGKWAVERLITESASGRTLWDSSVAG
jgi:hypothetical protein